jgi:hypothetical protein
VQSTAFSSLPGSQLRKEAAYLMERSIREGGYIFWWDLLHAHRFADGERLEPKLLFPSMQLISERRVSLRPDLNDALRWLRGAGKWVSSVLAPLGHPPTHLCAFLRDIDR